jgi:hypothetical protein
MDTLLNLQLAAHRTQSVSARLSESLGVGSEISILDARAEVLAAARTLLQNESLGRSGGDTARPARGIDEGLDTVA